MHAKLTRDRKKCFISTIESTIGDLEDDISRMRNILIKVGGLGSVEEGTASRGA
jgi:hypothetical protein